MFGFSRSCPIYKMSQQWLFGVCSTAGTKFYDCPPTNATHKCRLAEVLFVISKKFLLLLYTLRYRHVTAVPAWGKRLSQTLPAGETVITYSAANPDTNKTATCYLTISVLDKEDPMVINCPEDIEYNLYSSEPYKNVYWNEPQFSDNVGIVSLYRSKVRS